MMTSWIPNISGFLRRSRSTNEVEAFNHRSLAHEARPPLTHVTALSLDSVEEPELIGETEILDTDLVRSLSENLPSRLVGSDWRLIYSTSSHGFSLSSFYRRCSTSTNGPTLLCIRDIEDNIFGALVSSPIVISESFYGTGETFLFTSTPRFRMFKWSGENPHFARGNLDCGLTLACVRGGPRPAPPTTTLPWWRPGTSWSRQSSAGPLTEILMPGYQSSIRDESDINMHNVISNNGCVVYIIHRKTGDLYKGRQACLKVSELS